MILPFILVSLGAAGLSLVALRKANATPLIPTGPVPLPGEEPSGEEGGFIYVPTANDILSSGSFSKLDAYYKYIGDLYITGAINSGTYDSLYQAYYDRWNELAGV